MWNRDGIWERIPIGIDSPLQPRGSQSRDPLLRKIKICSTAEVPSIANARSRFYVKPEVVDNDIVCLDDCQELVDLGLRGFAGALRLGARAWDGEFELVKELDVG